MGLQSVFALGLSLLLQKAALAQQASLARRISKVVRLRPVAVLTHGKTDSPQSLSDVAQHYLEIGHAKRHHMIQQLARRGDAAFGNNQTLRRSGKLLLYCSTAHVY